MYLKGKDYPTDMDDLCKELDRAGLKYEKKVHPVYAAEPQVKDIIGYSPAGEWQVLIITPEAVYSVIRGMASFGHYEVMKISGVGDFDDPERFSEPAELIEALTEEE